MRKPGCVEPVIYFVRSNGHHMLAPYTSAPTPDDCRREEADTLAAIDRLCAILCDQEKRVADKEMEGDAAYRAPREQAIRDRLYSRMTSGATSEYEKEFIRLYLQLRDERKRETYRQRYMEMSWFLHAREYDLGKRAADKEEFNWEKHEVKE